MDFLVELRQDWAALRALPDLDALVARERAVGAQLVADGSLQQIWRLPGARANIGIWRAVDATQLHRLLQQLPLWPWLEASVTPLAEHELAAVSMSAAGRDRP